MNRLKIQLVTNLFAPDELAGAALFSDLALYLKEQGADVRVATTYSYYPAWKVDPEDARHAYRDEMWADIPVRRIRMHVPAKPTGAGRLLSDLSFLVGLLRFATSRDWTPDVVVTASPMFSQCLAQRFLYRGKNVPRFIVVQDFVVDAALELGILKLPGLAGLLRGLERWSFRSAQTLSTISEAMLLKLRRIVGNDRKTLVIPNWIHRSLEVEISKQSVLAPVREDKLMFYSGNLGMKQGLAEFISDFETSRAGWRLRVHGDGAQRAKLAEKVSNSPGVDLGGVLSEAAYVSSLLGCSVALVTQTPGVGANFLPSKLLPALATGTPVLAVCDHDSPLGQEVSRGGFGAVVRPGDQAGLREVLGRWGAAPNSLADLRAQALRWGERFKREVVLPQYGRELSLLVSESRSATF